MDPSQQFGVHELTAALNGTLLTGAAPLTATAPSVGDPLFFYPPLTATAIDNGDGILHAQDDAETPPEDSEGDMGDVSEDTEYDTEEKPEVFVQFHEEEPDPVRAPGPTMTTDEVGTPTRAKVISNERIVKRSFTDLKAAKEWVQTEGQFLNTKTRKVVKSGKVAWYECNGRKGVAGCGAALVITQVHSSEGAVTFDVSGVGHDHDSYNGQIGVPCPNVGYSRKIPDKEAIRACVAKHPTEGANAIHARVTKAKIDANGDIDDKHVGRVQVTDFVKRLKEELHEKPDSSLKLADLAALPIVPPVVSLGLTSDAESSAWVQVFSTMLLLQSLVQRALRMARTKPSSQTHSL